MHESVPHIDCPIDLFRKQESQIQELTRRINEAQGIRRKAEAAWALREEVETLLRCSAFDKHNIHCVNCQAISGVRSKTATLLLRTQEALDRTPA